MRGKEGVRRAVWVIPILLLVTLVYNPMAEAGRRDDHHDNNWRPHSNYHSGILYSGKNFTIALGTHTHGRFCGHRHVTYEPVPVIFRTIPYGCRRIRIDGLVYYEYNNTYYLEVAGGYQIVEVPERFTVESRRDNNDYERPQDISNGGVFTINIPNSRGGYTAIILKRSRSGFTGPQGEFYPEFPKVDQLKAMYAK